MLNRLPALPPFAIAGCAIAMTAFQAGAQTSNSGLQLDVPEFQRRLEICLAAEDWLQRACLDTLRTRGAIQKTEAPTKEPMTEPAKETTIAVDELHMVGIYEASNRQTADGIIHRGEVPINVDRPGKSVALVMGSYRPVRWVVTASPGTKVARIIVGGRNARRTEVTLNGKPAHTEFDKLPLAYKSQGNRFQPFHEAAARLAGVAKADSFQGAYKAPDSGFSITAAPGVRTRKEILAKLEAEATDPSSLSALMRAAIAGDGAAQRAKWQFGKSGFVGVNENGEAVQYDLSLDVPDVSWPVGTAYDPKSQTLWGVTLGGEGFLYEYNIPKNRWLAWSMNNFDAGGLIFDGQTGRLIATPGRHITRGYIVMDTKANVIASVQISNKDYPGLIDTYDPGNGPAPSLEPIAIEGSKILVRAKHRLTRDPASHPNLVYLVDLNSQTVELVR